MEPFKITIEAPQSVSGLFLNPPDARACFRFSPTARAPHRAGTEGLAAEHTTGIGHGAAAQHVEGHGTSPASSGSRRGP